MRFLRGPLAFLMLCAVVGPSCGGGGSGGGGGGVPPTFVGVGVAATPSVGTGAVPAGLSPKFELGLANFDLTWVSGAGVPFKMRSQYLSGGVNTGSGWTTWNSPAGQFALLYMNASDGAGMIPVFNYYQLRGSSPNVGSENPDPKLQNPATMSAYYAEFKLLMQKCATFNKIVIVHVEPDFWGFCQSTHGSKPENIPVCVANTGVAEAAGLNDNLCGFAQLLVKLRDVYAPHPAAPPKVLIAFHASAWGSGADLIKNAVDPVTQANAIGGYFTALGANFDLLLHDPADRDAGYYQYFVGDGGASWWAVPADFDRYRNYLARMKTVTGRRGILWQVPLGNTKMKTGGNIYGHYQDNRVEYWLDDVPHANVTAYAGAGVMAILWGAPQDGTTHYDDARGDGITNGGPAGTVSTVSDDDGGYFRLRAAAYYSTTSGNPGPVTLP
ncbi:MAG TPA: hypothetical protein VE981_05405 [Planctomycetota bacterium]|nr:hypothetical protein [Planctomycetota bacterium]